MILSVDGDDKARGDTLEKDIQEIKDRLKALEQVARDIKSRLTEPPPAKNEDGSTDWQKVID